MYLPHSSSRQPHNWMLNVSHFSQRVIQNCKESTGCASACPLDAATDPHVHQSIAFKSQITNIIISSSAWQMHSLISYSFDTFIGFKLWYYSYRTWSEIARHFMFKGDIFGGWRMLSRNGSNSTNVTFTWIHILLDWGENEAITRRQIQQFIK